MPSGRPSKSTRTASATAARRMLSKPEELKPEELIVLPRSNRPSVSPSTLPPLRVLCTAPFEPSPPARPSPSQSARKGVCAREDGCRRTKGGYSCGRLLMCRLLAGGYSDDEKSNLRASAVAVPCISETPTHDGATAYFPKPHHSHTTHIPPRVGYAIDSHTVDLVFICMALFKIQLGCYSLFV